MRVSGRIVPPLPLLTSEEMGSNRQDMGGSSLINKSICDWRRIIASPVLLIMEEAKNGNSKMGETIQIEHTRTMGGMRRRENQVSM